METCTLNLIIIIDNLAFGMTVLFILKDWMTSGFCFDIVINAFLFSRTSPDTNKPNRTIRGATHIKNFWHIESYLSLEKTC